MTQEELKESILSRIKDNREFWVPKIKVFFKETPNVTLETMETFFDNWLGRLRIEADKFDEAYKKERYGDRKIPLEVSLSDYEYERYDVARRKQGLIPLEDVASARGDVEMYFDEIELTEFQAEMAHFADQFKNKAIEAFNKNDRFACAIFYVLYAISRNKELKDIYIKRFLMARVFTPSLKVTTELALDESQQQKVLECFIDSSSYYSFGRFLYALDVSQVEGKNLPFKPSSQDFAFFDFTLICLMNDTIPVVKTFVSKPHLDKYQLHRLYKRSHSL